MFRMRRTVRNGSTMPCNHILMQVASFTDIYVYVYSDCSVRTRTFLDDLPLDM